MCETVLSSVLCSNIIKNLTLRTRCEQACPAVKSGPLGYLPDGAIQTRRTRPTYTLWSPAGLSRGRVSVCLSLSQ